MGNHYSPHRSAKFEGYYSKFRLPSGSSIALIISTVAAADPSSSYSGITSDSTQVDRYAFSRRKRDRPYMISFTYVSADGKRWWQTEEWPDAMFTEKRGDGGFIMSWDGGVFQWDGVDRVEWRVEGKSWKFHGRTEERGVCWQPGDPSSTPAGILASLPLPIQWHVHSLDTPCSFTLSIEPGSSNHPDSEPALPSVDEAGDGRVHIEKNWAIGFPTSYIWIQARDHERKRGVCLAGGALIKGVEAYLVGYDGGQYVSFMPPTSTSIFGLSLGLDSRISYGERLAEIIITGWFTQLRIRAQAPPDTFFTLAAPLSTGHAPGYTVQSFAASVEVEVARRRWPWGGWSPAEQETFEGGSLELGGDFYEGKNKQD